MKKITLLTVLFLFAGIATSSAQGFYYGPKGGVNVSSLTKTSFSKSRLRAFVGAFGGYQLEDFVALQAEVLYSWQGTTIDSDDTKVKNSLNYLKIPILAKFFVIGGLNVEAGVSFDFNVGAKTKAEGESQTISGLTKGFDFSIPIGVNYQFAQRFEVGLRYYLSTAKVWEVSKDKSKNSVWAIGLGIRL